MRKKTEAGFTLVEALTAIVILVFGLIAVTNLLIVAGNSSHVANAGTAASAIASEQMEALKATSFFALAPGGNLDTTLPGTAGFARSSDPASPFYEPRLRIPGAGAIEVRWTVLTPVAGQTQLAYIVVRAEARGVMLGRRTRAQFSALRACTGPIPSGGICAAAPCCPPPP